MARGRDAEIPGRRVKILVRGAGANELFLVLRALVAEGGTALPSVAELARRLGCEHSHVQNAFDVLARRGWIEVWRHQDWPGAVVVRLGAVVLRNPKAQLWGGPER